MKSRKITALLIITNIILIGIICNFISRNGNVVKEKQVIKEMTQSENESNLQTQIDQLNLAHEEYAQNVQKYKKQIAEAITNQGVNTSENATASVMAENIGKILELKTVTYITGFENGYTAYNNYRDYITLSNLEVDKEYTLFLFMQCTYGGDKLQNITFSNGTIKEVVLDTVRSTSDQFGTQYMQVYIAKIVFSEDTSTMNAQYLYNRQRTWSIQHILLG